MNRPLPLQSNGMKNIPQFLNKLYTMVGDASTDHLIHWSESGSTFVVTNHEDFARDVLPRYFKHNNFSSFIRQLNMYGFHKVQSINQGVLLSSGEEKSEFEHPHFHRNQPDLLCLVTRKKGRNEDEEKAVDINLLVQEMSQIKKHQMVVSNDLKNVQRDNQVLWNELMSMREKYKKQQELVDKILRFLAAMFVDKKKGRISGANRLLLDNVTNGNNVMISDTPTDVASLSLMNELNLDFVDRMSQQENATTVIEANLDRLDENLNDLAEQLDLGNASPPHVNDMDMDEFFSHYSPMLGYENEDLASLMASNLSPTYRDEDMFISGSALDEVDYPSKRKRT